MARSTGGCRGVPGSTGEVVTVEAGLLSVGSYGAGDLRSKASISCRPIERERRARELRVESTEAGIHQVNRGISDHFMPTRRELFTTLVWTIRTKTGQTTMRPLRAI